MNNIDQPDLSNHRRRVESGPNGEAVLITDTPGMSIQMSDSPGPSITVDDDALWAGYHKKVRLKTSPLKFAKVKADNNITEEQ